MNKQLRFLAIVEDENYKPIMAGIKEIEGNWYGECEITIKLVDDYVLNEGTAADIEGTFSKAIEQFLEHARERQSEAIDE